jgi:anaerobic selenocysteine-containing dehydrogenase
MKIVLSFEKITSDGYYDNLNFGFLNKEWPLFFKGEIIMSNQSRRNFMTTSVKFLAGSAVLTATGALAGEHQHKHGGSGNGLVVDATMKNICATCQHWGAMRKVSKDRKNVTIQSMGWCSNPDSPNYQELTSADHVMNDPGIWKKWSAI